MRPVSGCPKPWEGRTRPLWSGTVHFGAIIFFILALAPGVLDLLGLHCKARTLELIESIRSIMAGVDAYYFSTLNMNDRLSWWSNNKFGPSYAACWLCDLGQVTLLLSPSLFLSVKWGLFTFTILGYIHRILVLNVMLARAASCWGACGSYALCRLLGFSVLACLLKHMHITQVNMPVSVQIYFTKWYKPRISGLN